MRWLLALLALVVPPILLLRGRGRGALLAALLWVAGIAVFFLVAWGVGAIMVLLSGLFAFVLALRK